MSQRAPGWVVPVMRAGYTARAIVYVIIAIFAGLAAWQGGSAEGAKGALGRLLAQPMGEILLWIVAIGLFCYSVWRLLAAWMDLERHGTDAKGIVARAGLMITGLIHAALGVQAIAIAMGSSAGGRGSGQGSSKEEWTAWLLQQSYGKWIVVAIGLSVVGAGIYYGYKGWSDKYKEHLQSTRTSERLAPACKFGLIAHGVVIVIIGAFFVWAGWTSDPSEAGGLGQAFGTVRDAAMGRILLGILALGMLGFAIYCLIEARYRVVPARAGDDVSTLAPRVEAKARDAGRRAANAGY